MKYYEGTELKWSAEDVLIRAKELDVEITEAEAEIILIATFDDNEYIMEMIGDIMKGTILEHMHNIKSK